MENIEIESIKLLNLHVAVNKEEIVYDASKVQAMLQIQYNFEQSHNKRISYRIVVGESPDNSLYHVKCEYSFTMKKEGFLDQDIVTTVMDMLQPRIEEILALITFEAGFAPSECINN